SIFNESVHSRFPLIGLQFKNTSSQTLTQGPVTVYEDGKYGGDARLPDLQPGEERLLSFAVDLGTEVQSETKTAPTEVKAVKLVQGTLHVTRKVRITRTYLIKNRSKQDRTVIVEHPYHADWTLVSPSKPKERSRDVYRIHVSVPAGQTV